MAVAGAGIASPAAPLEGEREGLGQDLQPLDHSQDMALALCADFEVKLERRANPARLSGKSTRAVVGATAGAAHEPRRGLNPYMLQCSRHLQAVKAAKGSALPPEEVARTREEFRRMWASVGQAEVFTEAYEEWRHTARQDGARDEVPKYNLVWGGGCHTTPITAPELNEFVQKVGWPTDDEAPRGSHL